MNPLSRGLGWLLLRLIDGYAVALGPHLGGRCRFEPSCSNYARQAISRFGPGRGSFLALRRIIKCGPWHQGGYDPVPDFPPENRHTHKQFNKKQ